ncbi:MAG: 16S rRNA (cytidine(1402)-2'-O)-methyltransferase [Bacilli bacterium]
MKSQKSYIDEGSCLYLIPTPIGNLEDMTFRSIQILKDVDYIFCEDTRVTKVLLSHFNILTPLYNYHIFNEDVASQTILDYLGQGNNVALVSDAGNPCISDPGFLVSKEAIKAGYKVISVPGASASLTALIASGLPCDKFYFYGFLNSKQSKRRKQLEICKDIKETIIYYEAPHRIMITLQDMLDVLGDREIVIGRELTKRYEEYIRGNISDILAKYTAFKGEMVIIVKGSDMDSNIMELNELTIQEHFDYYNEQLENEKEAMKKVAKDRKITKSEVYKEIKVK